MRLGLSGQPLRRAVFTTNMHSEASDLDLHCLPRPVYLNVYGKYGICAPVFLL